MLQADFTHRASAFTLRLTLAIDGGETVALLGPNGAGKSTSLAVLAGVRRVDTGSIALAGRVLDDGRAALGPSERGVGLVWQQGFLFPHLSALDNVAFGLRARGVARGTARSRARTWLETVDAAALERKRPRELSGGEAQRVALARALATDPELLLLDEPLAAVDASARLALRRVLRERLTAHAGASILVTHDPLDAFSLADRIVVLEEGRIVQSGTAAEISARPRSRYVADLVGLNLCEGTVEDGVLVTTSGARLVVASAADGPALATIHPRSVALYPRRPDGSPRNVWEAPIVAIESTADGDRLRVTTGGELPLVAEVTPNALAELELAVGRRSWVALKATEVNVTSV